MWTVLRSIKCWEKYQHETAQTLGVLGLPISWGSGPKEYPALITTYMPPVQAGSPPKLVSAYVYESDAIALLQCTGVKVAKPIAAQQIGPSTQVLTSDIPHQGDYNRWVTAYLIALTRELREVGALKAGPFEQSLMEALQLVDEVATEKKDEILAKLDKADKAILDRLGPPG